MNACVPITSKQTKVVPMPRFLLSLTASVCTRCEARFTANSSMFRMSLLRDLGGAYGLSRVVHDQIGLLLDLVVHGAHGERARHFTRGVPAHPVANDEQPELFIDQKVVFVLISHSADIGQCRELDFGCGHHRSG